MAGIYAEWHNTGAVCAVCGKLITTDPPGYPQLCPVCEEKEKESKDDEW